MNKKLVKVAVFAAFSFFSLISLNACGDDSSSVNSAANNTTLNGSWYYYVGSNNVDVKWGAFPDLAPIQETNSVGEGYAVAPSVIASCSGGVCGKVSLKSSADGDWNALLLQYFIEPDNWQNGNDLSALQGICLKYNVIYSGDAVNDYTNSLQVMSITLEAADNLVSARDYNAKFRYNVDENLITGNLGDIRVLNLAWSDFVWPTSDTFYANEPYTLEQAVAHLHGIQIRLVQFGEQNVTVAFNIQKIGVYGTCAD